MASILDTIIAKKRQEISEDKEQISQGDLAKRISGTCRGFAAALSRAAAAHSAIIAEIKRGSPSLGCIRPDMDAVEQAKAYESAGAACLSVLTDAEFFFARDDDFAEIRQQSSIPMLRKDFMIDPYQIYQSRAMGADCILLIMACLDNDQAAALADTAHELEMDVLAETHNEDEIQRTLDYVNFDLIGVNNRNLNDFTTSVELTVQLSEMIDDKTKLVAESGLHSATVLQELAEKGIRRFLIGEAFVKSDNPQTLVHEFVNAVKVENA
ncbi:MAG: indole-3-glycerol phosphate synthase TrpC [Lentisphaeria bacterium]|nr:indole-3-glycerol phosphate synthase TrpC [Lentisphaeria bacterium]NQZ69290.1 indole-3-glycerol phosphate synthase TrpC [Lentisphaeria bacterium]